MSRKFSPEMNQPLESRELPTAQLAHAEVFKIRNTVSPKSIIDNGGLGGSPQARLDVNFSWSGPKQNKVGCKTSK